MRTIIQRVEKASVSVNGETISKIKDGFLVLIGIEENDTDADVQWSSSKISQIRLFPDENQKMNLSLMETGDDIIVVSQFTLHASTKKGNRPSFIKAAKPEIAEKRYLDFIEALNMKIPGNVYSGKFGAMMQVALINSGPVTIFIDSKNKE